MRRYCDLNVRGASSLSENIENIRRLIQLGYHAIAINYEIKLNEKIGKKAKKSVGASPSSEDEKYSHIFVLMKKLKAELNIMKVSGDIPNDVELLSRVTVDIKAPEHVRLLTQTPYKELLNSVDLISLCPDNEKIFRIILDGKAECDIISFRLENKFDFKQVTHNMVGVAVGKNIFFEICYSQAIRSVRLRRYIFHNGRSLISKMKKAKGVIFSSNGESKLDFRSPLDIANLAHLFDVNNTVCLDVVSKNCHQVIAHAKIRKLMFKGALVVEKISDEDHVPAKKIKIENHGNISAENMIVSSDMCN